MSNATDAIEARIDINQHEACKDDEPFTLTVLKRVEAKLNELGYNVTIVEECTVSPESKLKDGCGRTPPWWTGSDNPVREFCTEVGFPLDLKKRASENYENVDFPEEIDDSKAHVTTFFNHLGLTLEETIEEFEKDGQFDAALAYFGNLTDDEVNNHNVLAWTVAMYARGWYAERIITDTERFGKLWVTNDQAGHDARDMVTNQDVQIKCVTTNDDADVYYQWDMRGGIHVGTKKTAVNGRAVNVTGMLKTVARKCYDGKRDADGNTFRYIWW